MCEYLSRLGISAELTFRVKTSMMAMQHLADQADIGDEDETLMMLPADLRRALREETRSTHVLFHPLFASLQELHRRTFQRLCCDGMQMTFPDAGYNVFSYGEASSLVYFVVAGEVNYLKYNDVAGMSELMTDWYSSGGGLQESSAGTSFALKSSVKSRRSLSNLSAAGVASMASSASMASDPVLGKPSGNTERSTTIGAGLCVCEPALWIMWWRHRGDLDSPDRALVLTLDVVCFADIASSYPVSGELCRSYAARFITAFATTSDNSDLYTFSDMLACEA